MTTSIFKVVSIIHLICRYLDANSILNLASRFSQTNWKRPILVRYIQLQIRKKTQNNMETKISKQKTKNKNFHLQHHRFQNSVCEI